MSQQIRHLKFERIRAKVSFYQTDIKYFYISFSYLNSCTFRLLVEELAANLLNLNSNIIFDNDTKNEIFMS